MVEETSKRENPLQQVLQRLRDAVSGEKISVDDLICAIGQDSFSTVLLVVALVMVTPLSGIPGAPTIGALIILLIVGQWLFHTPHLWLPDFVKRRTIEPKRFRKSLTWLDKPARFVDRHTRYRLTYLTRGPARWLLLLGIAALVLTWPFLELLPFFTTVCAVGVAIVAFALMTNDGVYVLVGLTYFVLLGFGALTIFPL